MQLANCVIQHADQLLGPERLLEEEARIAYLVAGVGVGSALVGLISHVKIMPDFTPFIGVMIGLGVGIDYALFIVSRYREATTSTLAVFEPPQTELIGLAFAVVVLIIAFGSVSPTNNA